MVWKFRLALGISIAMILVGVLLTGIWLWWSLVDYGLLNAAWARLMALSKTPGVSTQRLMVAIADQDAHRLNMVAEITGMMLGALIAAVGGHAVVICLTARKDA